MCKIDGVLDNNARVLFTRVIERRGVDKSFGKDFGTYMSLK